MYPRIPRLPDIPGHGKSLKNNEFINIFKKNGAGARVLESTISFSDECFTYLLVFVAKFLGVSWGRLGLA